MLNIKEIKDDILKNERKYVFDHINFLGNFDDIKDYIINTDDVMYDFVNKNRKDNHLEYILALINSYLENKKVLMPIMQNISFCSGVVLVEKEQNIEDISGQIPQVSYYQITKENFHIYKDNLIDFLKVSLSFKVDVLFPTIGLSDNKDIKDLIKKQFLYNIGEFRSYIKKCETENYSDENARDFKDRFLKLTDENASMKERIEIYERVTRNLFIDQSNLWYSINCEWNKEKIGEYDKNLVISYIDKITELNNNYNLQSLIRNLDRESLLYIYGKKDELKEKLKHKYIFYNRFVDYNWNQWKPSYVYDLIDGFDAYHNGSWEDKIKRLNDVNLLLDGVNLPKKIDERIVSLKKEIILDLDTSSLNIFENKIKDFVAKKFLYKSCYAEIMKLKNTKISLKINKIIKGKKIEFSSEYLNLKYPNGFYFLEKYREQFFNDNKDFLVKNNRGNNLIFENIFNISMQDFEKYVIGFLDFFYEVKALKHDEKVEITRVFFEGMVREIRLKERLHDSGNTENIIKNKRKI